MRTLGQRLKAKRIREGLSLRDLEAIVGVSFSGIARVERDAGQPTDDTAARILRWLDSGTGTERREKRGRPWIVTIEQRLARIEAELGLEGESK